MRARSLPGEPVEVRLRHFVVGVVLMFACSKAVERLRARATPLVVLEGNGAFGNQAVTTVSAPRTFVVRPAPPATSLQFDRVESIESTCPEFQVSAPGAAGAVVQRICTAFGGGGYGGGGATECVAFEEQDFPFEVRFAPTVELPSSDQCRIIVRLDGGTSRSIPVSGTGVPPALSIDISPRDPIDFFTINAGTTSSARAFTVRNKGTEPLSIAAVTDLAGGVFAVTGTTPTHALAPGAAEVYQLTCTPPTADLFTGSITITSNDPDPADASVLIPLTCQGIDHPLQSTDGAEAQLLVGQSTTIDVALHNLTAGTVTGITAALQDPVLPGLAISQPPATTLGPNGDTTIQLAWTPPTPYKGALGALVLTVDGEAPRVIGIGMARATIADVQSDLPDNEKLDFGRLCIGESRTRPFKMQPGGSDANVFADYTVLGVAAASPFAATLPDGPSLVRVVNPTTAVVEVTAMEMISDGRFDGAITITTDSPSEPTLDVPATVEVLQGGTSVSPPLLDFHDVIVTGFSETKTATFTNCTADTIEVTGILLDGESAADFAIIQIMPDGTEQLPPFTLPRGGEVTIAVQMLPQTSGAKSAQISIDFQEPAKPETSSETVTLLGEGFFKRPDRGSYYRCSTGAPVEAAPIGLVLGFLVLRRRRRRR